MALCNMYFMKEMLGWVCLNVKLSLGDTESYMGPWV